jgi:hypothetical protein
MGAHCVLCVGCVQLDDIARFRKTKLKLIIDASNDQDP